MLIDLSQRYATTAHIVFRKKSLIVVYFTRDHVLLEETIEVFNTLEYAEAYAEKLNAKYKK